MKKLILLLLSILTAFSVSAQALSWQPLSVDEASNVYVQLNKLYNQTSSYELAIHYASYKDYTTTVEYEQSTGYFKKYGNNYHSILLGIHTIQNNKYKIVLDTVSKVLAVANPDSVFKSGMTMVDYKSMLQYGEALKTATVGTEKHYRIEFNETYPISACEYTMNSTGWITELTIYYNKEITNEEGNSEKIKPRLKMTFSGYRFNISQGVNELNEKIYFTKQGYKITLIGKYKDYMLSDQRVIPN